MYKLSSVAAGPVLRRVGPNIVCVWLALPAASTVCLRVLGDQGQPLLAGESKTHALGRGLHIALVSATGGSELAWGQTYQYEIDIDNTALDVEELLYQGGPGRLSFVMPGAALEDTRIVHGSCRHPTNRGVDALSLLDTMIERSIARPSERPQVFVCSGDLIYADSPSVSLLRLVGELGEALLGYRELLPGLDCVAAEIPVARRKSIAKEHAKIYAAPAHQLFGLGEYLAMHLLVLSPSLWPQEVPSDLRPFHSTLANVRRALANTAFYAIFDDHEITDDWYLTRAWCERVLGAALGRRMVANGLAAFAAVHACGNTPWQFQEGEAGHALFEELSKQEGVSPGMETMLGMPDTVGDSMQPPPGSLFWHFTVQTPAIDLRALDTRTMRAFPLRDPHGQPDLLSADAIENQLSNFSALPVLVVPAPMAPPPRTRGERFLLWLNDRISLDSRVERLVYQPDKGDEWLPASAFFERVLNELPANWICLGGDTHLAYAARIDQTAGSAAIFCSSGMQRETPMRLARQALGFSFPWPWPASPKLTTEVMSLRYLESETTDAGKRYQYLSKNNIGELRFGVSESVSRAEHCLWWQDARGAMQSVRHEVSLRTGKVSSPSGRGR